MIDSLLTRLGIPPRRSQITFEESLKFTYDYWRSRTLYSMLLGYAAFYFVRKNIAIANPVMREELGISATAFGVVLTGHSIIYGLSKFFSGILADRSNARYFMAIGLFLSAVMNYFFGLSSSLLFFGTFWMLNGLFQGSGVPPCSRMLTAWFSKKESGTYWGIWNASHQVGGAGISLLAGYLITAEYGWRATFYIPATLAVIVSLLLVLLLRDRPTSLGLPPIEEFKKDGTAPPDLRSGSQADQINTFSILRSEVLNKPIIWIVSLANIFIYIVRIGFLDWGTTYLNESGLEESSWGIIIAIFEITGLAGALAAGALSDRMTARRGMVAVASMALLTICLLLFWHFPTSDPWQAAFFFGLIGLFVYGPQLLVAVIAAQAAPRAAGTAVGLTGLAGYLGSSLCSILTGVFLDNFGIDSVVLFYLASAIIGTLLFVVSLIMEAEPRNAA
ncbi:MAG: MFS transporter [Leptospiraceae bacterium]|nr:MFS transporter [Leptospiraceae bacterium]